MEIVRMTSGFISQRLSKKEQENLWNELSVDVSPVGKDMAQYTPNDNLEYFIVSTKEVANFKYETVLKIQGKKHLVKHNDCNQDEKMYKVIRTAYGLDKK